MRAKAELRPRAVELRLRGWTYLQIAAEVGVSKSTLSLWLRDVELPDDEKEAREARRKAVGAARSISARSARQRRVRLIHDSAAAEIGTLTSRELEGEAVEPVMSRSLHEL
jgi:transcriptional regulator with XRE-family HTH domain